MTLSRSGVYFAYVGEEGTDAAIVRQRLLFMDRQLDWLARLARMATHPIDFLVPYVAPRAWDGEVQRIVARHGFVIDPACLAEDRRNRFEYPGFRALKAFAAARPADHLLFYCHSKGIVHLDEGKMGLFRLHTEVALLADLSRLIDDPLLTRAALFPSRFGWCWYNIFWVKAGRMAARTVEEQADRYEFEALIGDRGDGQGHLGVLPLVDRLPPELTGIPRQPWYRPAETISPTLVATYDGYARLDGPSPLAGRGDARYR